MMTIEFLQQHKLDLIQRENRKNIVQSYMTCLKEVKERVIGMDLVGKNLYRYTGLVKDN